MVVGQDWGTVDTLLSGNQDGINPTDHRLKFLLNSVGIEIPEPPTGAQIVEDQVVFLTNATLCLKRGRNMQAGVNRTWFANCGALFLKPLIELVDPRVLVTLGWWAMDTVLKAYGLPAQKRFRDAVDNPKGIEMAGGVVLLPMYHCGNRVLNTHRCLEQQKTDWARLKGVGVKNGSRNRA